MVVKSSTKKQLMDLGIPQAVAIELANNRRWDDDDGDEAVHEHDGRVQIHVKVWERHSPENCCFHHCGHE